MSWFARYQSKIDARRHLAKMRVHPASLNINCVEARFPIGRDLKVQW